MCGKIDDTMLHENEAAEVLYEICKGEAMHGSEVKEGKIELIADCDGVLKIDREKLFAVNSLGQMMIAARHGDFPVKAGEKIAGTRIYSACDREGKDGAGKTSDRRRTDFFSFFRMCRRRSGL